VSRQDLRAAALPGVAAALSAAQQLSSLELAQWSNRSGGLNLAAAHGVYRTMVDGRMACGMLMLGSCTW